MTGAQGAPVYRKDEGVLYEAIAKELLLQFNMHVLPQSMAFKNVALVKRFKEVVLFLDEFLELNGAKTKDKRRLFRLFSRIMVAWLDSIPNVPVTPLTVVRNAEKFPSLIEEQFPGYLRAGIFAEFALRSAAKRRTRRILIES